MILKLLGRPTFAKEKAFLVPVMATKPVVSGEPFRSEVVTESDASVDDAGELESTCSSEAFKSPPRCVIIAPTKF